MREIELIYSEGDAELKCSESLDVPLRRHSDLQCSDQTMFVHSESVIVIVLLHKTTCMLHNVVHVSSQLLALCHPIQTTNHHQLCLSDNIDNAHYWHFLDAQ